MAKRKFAPVPKNRSGTPLKYLEGLSSSEKKAKEAEMKRTAKKAKEGTLTKRGLGAYYSGGSRNVPASAWACGRVKSFATGKGGARKADADLLRKNAGGTVEFDAKKSDLDKDGKISKYERKRGEAIARNMRNGGMVELQARGCGAMMNNRRKTTRVPK
jgi:hypothetical protein